jgi:hypothetical protein
MNPAMHTQPPEPNYHNLYKLGGVAAWIVVGLTLSEVIGLAIYPQPGAVRDWRR